MFSHLEEPHQSLWSLLWIVSSVPFPTGEEVTSEAEKVRLGPPPENCWDTILSSSVRVLWVPGHNNPALYLFCHSDGPLLHINIYGG